VVSRPLLELLRPWSQGLGPDKRRNRTSAAPAGSPITNRFN
jgi:hypothetical protein